MSKTNDLPLTIEKELHKLPTDSLHNHFHQLSERAANAQEEMAAISLSSLLLCALELEHLKSVTQTESVTPWKKWVKENCDFSYETSNRYAKALRCVRDGLLPQVPADLIPDTAPSAMAKDELADTCRVLADSLRGLGGRRQLYLQLDIIGLPGGKKAAAKNGKKTDAEQDDIEEIFSTPLKTLGKLFSGKKHLKLTPPKARELETILRSYLDDLKLIS